MAVLGFPNEAVTAEPSSEPLAPGTVPEAVNLNPSAPSETPWLSGSGCEPRSTLHDSEEAGPQVVETPQKAQPESSLRDL